MATSKGRAKARWANYSAEERADKVKRMADGRAASRKTEKARRKCSSLISLTVSPAESTEQCSLRRALSAVDQGATSHQGRAEACAHRESITRHREEAWTPPGHCDKANGRSAEDNNEDGRYQSRPLARSAAYDFLRERDGYAPIN